MSATPVSRSGTGIPEFEAVILAGGRGTRLGGIDKPGVVVGSTTMAASVTGACAAAGAHSVVLVGPARADLAKIADSLPGGLSVVREDPAGGGPVPALRAGLPAIRAPWVAVLAADLPFLQSEQVGELLSAGREGLAAGVVMTDDSGAAQWLVGCWQTARLRSALDDYGGSSLRGLLGPLNPALVSCPVRRGEPPPWLDCDTPAELAAARAWPRATATHPVERQEQ